jgi:hypothetical protein
MGWLQDLFGRDVRDEARTAVPVLRTPPPPPPAARRPGIPYHSVICGHLFDDGTLCRVPVGPDHVPTRAHAMPWEQHEEAPTKPTPPPPPPPPPRVSEPHRGLFEAISGDPLPSYSELRERYGDPGDLPPVNAAAEMADGQPLPATDTGRVDFREMLTSDHAWSVKTRLENVLGRPYLSTKIAEQLTPQFAVDLCDRLEALLTDAEQKAVERLTLEVAGIVDQRVREWQRDKARVQRAREVTRERFTP